MVGHVSILNTLVNQSVDYQVGIIGSPSDTTEIVIDIMQTQEETKILGQLVYMVIPQGSHQLAVLGQISRVETKNRWHEDLTFRGIIKRRGELPHLSGRADVRTATISVQAAFEFDENAPQPNVAEGVLAISPSTGVRVYRVRDEVLDTLLMSRRNEVVYLGKAYSTDVRMPFWLKHFGDGDGGAGEAYQIGVFGRTGSGKSGLAAYLLLGYARHRQMGILFVDPQGQFSTGQGLPFDLQEKLRLMGRDVSVYNLSSQIRLPENAPLFAKLLSRTGFYRKLGIKAKENQGYAEEEFAKVIPLELQARGTSLEKPGAGLFSAVIGRLAADQVALQNIYAPGQPLQRLISTLQVLQNDIQRQREFETECWTPVLDLFAEVDSYNNRRTSLNYIIKQVIGADGQTRPIVFLDISGGGTSFSDDDEIKALILREITKTLDWQGRNFFKQGIKLNCLVVLDEAHRFAKRASYDEDNELSNLINSFVRSVRETRKYGLGFLFITQTIASLHPEILGQLRIKFFGHGLNMGQELAKLKEEIGSDSNALSLYTSFTDPASTTKRQFPFMVVGPSSPLSFTGAPLFFQTFTDFEGGFVQANPFFRRR